MKEKELLSTISDFYTKFYNSNDFAQPICPCTNVFNLKVLKLDKNIINYGICEKCLRIAFFKEFKLYSNNVYNQHWIKLSIENVKRELEQLLNFSVSEIDLQYYTPKFDEILSKLDDINKKNKIDRNTLLNNEQ